MKFNIKPFRKAHQEKVIEQYIKGGVNAISFYCSVSYCPVIAAYTFCKEFDLENEELTRRIASVKLFYGITEVEE